ncbi:unnamed protein product [Schistosoma mattheei]|uniref:Uncharacterized protein n=1 Tax=Schistosoma mattheei TaxID=31246 RepID=A0A183NQT1_9TREM|nr:unnamed protein product [Schistosoma mattheei]
MELKTTVNQYQSHNLQYERQDSPTIRSWNFENYNNHHQEGTSIHKWLSTQDTQHPLAGYYQQQPNVGGNKPASS